MSDVLFEEVGNTVGLIRLNRPQVLNALNHTMYLMLDKQLAEWEAQKNIKAVVIQATPGRAFCAGGDIRQAYELGKKNPDQLADVFADEYRLNRRIFHYSKPYIALLNGLTMGGGAGISIHGAYRVATPQLTFAMPETSIGFFPDIGASYFLSRLPHFLGVYLGLTGVSISAADCLALGLVDVLVQPESLSELITKLSEAKEEAIKSLLSSYSMTSAPSDLLQHRSEIETCFSKNTVEDIIQALEAQQNSWCHNTAKLLKTKSPTSLKITLRELQQAKSLNFDACIDMEFQLMQHFVHDHDFYEGVRAAIVDKDKLPRWQPATLAEVTQHKVASYFESSSSKKFSTTLKNNSA